MRFKKSILSVISLLSIISLLTSCDLIFNNKPSIKDDDTSKVDKEDPKDDLVFPSSLPKKDLASPKDTLNSLEDLTYAIDYISFYELPEKVSFYISDEYNEQFHVFSREFEKAMNNSYIAADYYFETERFTSEKANIVSLNAIVRTMDEEISKGNDIPEVIHNLTYEELQDNELDPSSLYLANNSKGEVKVNSPTQLYYAINNCYLPVCEKGSYVEKLYINILDVLNKTYRTEDDKLNNLKRMYEYITHNITYDKVIANTDEKDAEKNCAFYIDGVFINKLAVCQGMAEAYSTLCNYVGYKNYVIRGTDDNNNGHAYNYVEYDNKWYLSCPTWGSFVTKIDSKLYQIPQYNMFLTTLDTPHKENWTFESLAHVDIEKKIESIPFDIYEQISCKSDDVKQIVNNITSCNPEKQDKNFSYEFNMINNTEEKLNKLVSLLEKHYPNKDISVLETPSFENTNYTLLFINK